MKSIQLAIENIPPSSVFRFTTTFWSFCKKTLNQSKHCHIISRIRMYHKAAKEKMNKSTLGGTFTVVKVSKIVKLLGTLHLERNSSTATYIYLSLKLWIGILSFCFCIYLYSWTIHGDSSFKYNNLSLIKLNYMKYKQDIPSIKQTILYTDLLRLGTRRI